MVASENRSGISARPGFEIPSDDLKRAITLAQSGKNQSLPHIDLVGDIYTILLKGRDTNGRFCLIEMLVPPGGGPPPHRHDFEETFIILEGELDAAFRGNKMVVRAGDTVNIPSNAPHQFHNSSGNRVRLLCICSPAGLEDFFMKVGTPVESQTASAAKPDKVEQEKLEAKLRELAPKYRIEILTSAEVASAMSET
jgi:mannose-6-phosphate isomerase-like protein (cupin superfamily)